MRAEVKSYRTNYLPIVPGEKRPALQSWQGRQVSRPEDNEAEVERWLAEGYWLAAITGKTSGDLVLLDFDRSGVYERWLQLVDQEVVKRLAVVSTQTPGRYHVWFRAPGYYERWKALGRKVAEDSLGLLIELRRGGQYGLVPCATCDRYQYALQNGVTVETAPELDAEDADSLVEAACALNEVPKGRPQEAPVDPDVRKPGVDFDRRGSIPEIIGKHGWKVFREADGVRYWTRPGKRRGISATEGYVDENKLYVFSSSCAPLEPDRAYGPFQLYALLDCGGDFHAAASALREQGFGENRIPDEVVQQIEVAIRTVRDQIEVAGKPHEPALIKDLEQNIPEFKGSWSRKRKEFGGDRIRYDYSIVYYVRLAGASYVETIQALYLHRLRFHDEPEEVLKATYVAPKIYYVDLKRKTGQSEDSATLSAEAEEVGSQTPVAALDDVNDRLGIEPKVAAVVKEGRRDSRYSLVMADGRRVALGGIEGLDDPRVFRRAVGDQLQVAVTSFTTRAWHGIYCALLRACEEIEEEEGELASILWHHIVRHVADKKLGDAGDLVATCKAHQPFLDGSSFHLHAPTLHESIGRHVSRPRELAGQRDLNTALRAAGFEPVHVLRKQYRYWVKDISEDQAGELRAAAEGVDT